MQDSHGPAPIQQHHLLFSRRRNGANCTRAPLPYARSVSVCLSVNPRCHGRHHTGNRSECDQNGLICPTRIAEITMRCRVGQVNNIEFFCPAHQSWFYDAGRPATTSFDLLGWEQHQLWGGNVTILSWHIMAHGPCPKHMESWLFHARFRIPYPNIQNWEWPPSHVSRISYKPS